MNHTDLFRVFWPVGHGGFFTEQLFIEKNNQIYPITVVYDCGTRGKAQICKNQVNNFLDPNVYSYGLLPYHRTNVEIIDLLFITHFDEDHIKCIEYLAKKAEIRNIVIPYFDEYDLLYLQYSNCCPSLTSTDIRASLNLPKSTNIYRVVSENDKQNIQFSPDHVHISIDSDADSRSGIDLDISSNSQFKSNLHPDWVWHVFNYDRPNNTPRIRAAIQQLLIDHGRSPLDLHYLIDNLSSLKSLKAHKSLKSDLRKIYGDTTARNNGSLVIFSGPFSRQPRYSNIQIEQVYNSIPIRMSFSTTPGFVYMGDYNAKDTVRLDAYLDFIKPHINHFSGLQVPHHGSSANFSSEILKNTFWSVIAAPENNKNGCHPDITVWSEMRLSGFAFKVTENEDTLLMQHCRYIY